MLTLGIGVSQAQQRIDSWSFGFGLSFPRYYDVNVTALNSNYGAYLSIQRNVSTHVGLRFKTAYRHMEGQWNDGANLVTQSTGLFTGDLDLMLYIIPCEPVTPYFFVGIGGNIKNISNGKTLPDGSIWGSQMDIGFGSEFKLNSNWHFTAEFSYAITNNSELDGSIDPNFQNSRDSYFTLNVGAKFYFDLGIPSPLCEPCQGISEAKTGLSDSDFNRIDEMIIKHIPKEVIKDVIVDKYIVAVSNDRLVLIGVNFAFDKSDLLPESYPVLDKSVKLLNDKPEISVEIEGYTDYIGTDAYNQTLSVQRAQTVRTYLISKGINENRLTTIGYGKTNPVADNTTDDGRAMNRRIVFRIIK